MEDFLSKILKEYGEKCPSMGEKILDYLNEYTCLLGTREYLSRLMKALQDVKKERVLLLFNLVADTIISNKYSYK